MLCDLSDGLTATLFVPSTVELPREQRLQYHNQTVRLANSSDRLVARLRAAHQRGVSIVLRKTTETVRDRVRKELPEAEVFVSGLEWLSGSMRPNDETEISRLVLVDESAILVSTFHETATGGHEHEQAVFGRGFDNGIVTIARRLMATGLLPTEDPGSSKQ